MSIIATITTNIMSTPHSSFLQRSRADFGKQLKISNNHGNTTRRLDANVVQQRRLKLVRSLHHSKADLRTPLETDDKGRTLLHEAALDGDVASVTAMISVHEIKNYVIF